MSAGTVFNLIQNEGWSGEDAWLVLAISFRESSFRPDVIAVCPAGTCQDEWVHAIGLMQVYWEVHQQYDYERLKEPAYNIHAAREIYLAAGDYSPWNPLDSAIALISYVQSLVASGGGGIVTEPGVSPGLDVAQPQITPPAALPPAPEPDPTYPPPYISPETNVPRLDIPGDDFDGFDNIVRYYKRDLRTLVEYDNDLIREITQLTGG